MKGEFFMTYKSIPAITMAGEPMTPSDDPGKEAIDTCWRAWNSPHVEQAGNGKSTHWDCEKKTRRETAKNN